MVVFQGLEKQGQFDTSSADPETTSFVADLEARLATLSPPQVVGIQAVRDAARSGQSFFGPVVHSDIAADRVIEGKGGELTLAGLHSTRSQRSLPALSRWRMGAGRVGFAGSAPGEGGEGMRGSRCQRRLPSVARASLPGGPRRCRGRGGVAGKGRQGGIRHGQPGHRRRVCWRSSGCGSLCCACGTGTGFPEPTGELTCSTAPTTSRAPPAFAPGGSDTWCSVSRTSTGASTCLWRLKSAPTLTCLPCTQISPVSSRAVLGRDRRPAVGRHALHVRSLAGGG